MLLVVLLIRCFVGKCVHEVAHMALVLDYSLLVLDRIARRQERRNLDPLLV